MNGNEPEENSVVFLKTNRFEVEQNAVFIDYNPQELISTLAKYEHLSIYHRISLAKNIEAIFDVCGEEALIPTLQLLAVDSEEIQSELVAYLSRLEKNGFSPASFDATFIQPLLKLINGAHLEVKEKASSVLSRVAHRLDEKQKREVIDFAVQLGMSDEEQNKIVSIQLIAQMTPDLPTAETEDFFMTRYLHLYTDSSVRIKKELISSVCTIGKNVSKKFLDEQIISQFYLQKCKENAWGVRKACVEIVSTLIQMTLRKKEELAQTLLIFTKDGNKTVRISAFKTIPEFIANYQSEKIPEKLVQLYLSLIDHEINQSVSREFEIIIKIAYFFPGVVQTLGGTRWDQLKRMFDRLIQFKHQDVKLPIASSLHVLGRIIGAEKAKESMFFALDTILKENSQFLKLSAIEHLSQFVELFDKITKEDLIDAFLVLQKDPKKWRVRHSFAHQLCSLSKLYDAEIIFKYIFPISLKLCNDNVSTVRREAAHQMYFVICSLSPLALEQDMALESIKGYGLSEKYIQRITFAMMLRQIYKISNFKSKFGDIFEELAADKVVLVRIAFANTVKQIIEEDPTQVSAFQDAIEILREDPQEDVHLQFM